MKNKLLIINIVSYIVLYHIVYELVFYFFHYNDNPTPLAYYFFHYNNNNLKHRSDLLFLTICFLFNLSISLLFWRKLYNWYGKIDTTELIFKLIKFFFIISVIIFVLFFIAMFLTKGLIFIIAYLLYLPTGILVVLMVPLFKFNQWIIERFST